MDLYKKELMSAAGELADLSNLLAATVLIYSSEGGNELHSQFLRERLAYELGVARNNLYMLTEKELT